MSTDASFLFSSLHLIKMRTRTREEKLTSTRTHTLRDIDTSNGYSNYAWCHHFLNVCRLVSPFSSKWSIERCRWIDDLSFDSLFSVPLRAIVIADWWENRSASFSLAVFQEKNASAERRGEKSISLIFRQTISFYCISLSSYMLINSDWSVVPKWRISLFSIYFLISKRKKRMTFQRNLQHLPRLLHQRTTTINIRQGPRPFSNRPTTKKKTKNEANKNAWKTRWWTVARRRRTVKRLDIFNKIVFILIRIITMTDRNDVRDASSSPSSKHSNWNDVFVNNVTYRVRRDKTDRFISFSSAPEREHLASAINLSATQVKIWFQNRKTILLMTRPYASI